MIRYNTHQRKFITFGTHLRTQMDAFANTKLLAILETKKRLPFISKLPHLDPNSARSVSQSSARTQPDLKLCTPYPLRVRYWWYYL